MKSVNRLYSQFKDVRHSLFYALITESGRKTSTLGDECKWAIEKGSISETSVVYSAGVGKDISFEKELVERFGCSVLLFDPSSTGRATMAQSENQNPKIDFEPIGLSDSDGTSFFEAPQKGEEGSYWKASAPSGSARSFHCSSLPTIMRVRGHSHIDLLKLDIEGFEYGILRQICTQKLPIRQICVEFHHSLIPNVRRRQTVGAILRLMAAGYRLISRIDLDHTFVRNI